MDKKVIGSNFSRTPGGTTMKVIRKGYEKEIICPKCGALLLYVQQDIHLIGDMEGDYSYCVKCPECNNNIKIVEESQ